MVERLGEPPAELLLKLVKSELQTKLQTTCAYFNFTNAVILIISASSHETSILRLLTHFVSIRKQNLWHKHVMKHKRKAIFTGNQPASSAQIGGVCVRSHPLGEIKRVFRVSVAYNLVFMFKLKNAFAMQFSTIRARARASNQQHHIVGDILDKFETSFERGIYKMRKVRRIFSPKKTKFANIISEFRLFCC